MQVMIIDVPTRERGLQVLDQVEAVVDVERFTVRDTALVYRADDGRTRIRQTRDAPATLSAPRVGGLGALLGLLATPRSAISTPTPFGWPASGPATPTPDAAADAAIDDGLIKRVAQHIDETKAAVVLLGDDATIDFLSGSAGLAEHDIEYVAVAPDPRDSDAGFTRYG